MSDKREGSAGGLSFAGGPAPDPSSTQPADTSPGPQSAAGSDSALTDEERQSRKAYRLAENYGMGPQKFSEYLAGQGITLEDVELARKALEAPYSGYNARPLSYDDEAKQIYKPMPVDRYTWGWLFRWGSFWIGAHWAKHNKRLCVNVIPCVTFWICAPGGNQP